MRSGKTRKTMAALGQSEQNTILHTAQGSQGSYVALLLELGKGFLQLHVSPGHEQVDRPWVLHVTVLPKHVGNATRPINIDIHRIKLNTDAHDVNSCVER